MPDVVDEHVDPAEIVSRRGNERVSDTQLANIAHHADTSLANSTLRVASAICVDLCEDDGRAFANEPLDNATPDAAATAGHDRHLAFEEHAQRRYLAGVFALETNSTSRGSSNAPRRGAYDNASSSTSRTSFTG
jgi:hypothetical protein